MAKRSTQPALLGTLSTAARAHTVVVAMTAAMLFAAPSQPPAVRHASARVGAVGDNTCQAKTPMAPRPFSNPQWNGWGVNTMQHGFQPAAIAGLQIIDVPRLRLKWSFKLAEGGPAYYEPAVIDGRVFVGSADGNVYALNADTACEYWRFAADAPVRTAVSAGFIGGRLSIYFGDGSANVYAVDALTGSLVWKRKVDRHLGATIIGAPTLGRKTMFVAVFFEEEDDSVAARSTCATPHGGLVALDASTGRVQWHSRNTTGLKPRRLLRGSILSSPVLDPTRPVLYVTTGTSDSAPRAPTSGTFAALDTSTGKLMWSRQVMANETFTSDIPAARRTGCPQPRASDWRFISTPMLVRLRGERRALVAGQTGGVVTAVDPDHQGRILWQTRLVNGAAEDRLQWRQAADAHQLYVALSAQNAATDMRRPDPNGGSDVFALDLESGGIAWHAVHHECSDRPGCGPSPAVAITVIPDVAFLVGSDGHLRAYATADGQLIWGVETNHEARTVTYSANRGTVDGPSAVIVGGSVFVNADDGSSSTATRTVLLAFTVDGR